MIERLFSNVPVEQRDWKTLYETGQDLDVGGKTLTGLDVTEDSAISATTVWACIRIISDGIATLPIEVTRGTGVDAQPVTQIPKWIEQPSQTCGAIDFRIQILWSLLLHGNAYILVIRDKTSNVSELAVLHPSSVEVDGSNILKPTYKVNGKPLKPGEMLHIKGYTLPGHVEGLSPIEYQRETIGLSIATQRYGSAFFGNSGVPSVVIEHPTQMTPEGASILKRSWEKMHKGVNKSNGVAVLTEGATLKQLSIPPEEAQFLDTRGFQVSDICRIYGVPPHLVADASNSTSWGSGLAEQNNAYVAHTLRPWVERIEEAFTALARSERPSVNGSARLFVSLRMDHLLRGDWAERLATYRTGLESGIYTLDEVRAFENLKPLPNGEGAVHRVPLNTAPTDYQDKQTELKKEDLQLKKDQQNP